MIIKWEAKINESFIVLTVYLLWSIDGWSRWEGGWGRVICIRLVLKMRRVMKQVSPFALELFSEMLCICSSAFELKIFIQFNFFKRHKKWFSIEFDVWCWIVLLEFRLFIITMCIIIKKYTPVPFYTINFIIINTNLSLT